MVKPYVHIGLTMGEKGMGYLTLFNHMPSGNQTWLGKSSLNGGFSSKPRLITGVCHGC
jgi:hypothetical protein